ncbi:hypothetical protein PFLmoz3_05218 [Pseudomonas fluorescens]|uniref:Uncharacterized protein n=1 Tax=Pseudomonas fluorescens TaxID=294 RepID=A0A120G681_PSEFL|nr:hypothetical protein PFLmoz3_05218 [Pseudomonas fluorescens]
MGGIEAGADGGAALGQLAHRGQGAADRTLGVIELGDKRRKFLAEGDRCGIHHVGTAGLDQLHMPRGQFCQPTGQGGDCRQQLLVHRLHRSNAHGGGEAVVGTLGTVDVIVGVHRALAAAVVAGQFVGAASDHFVGVHVALGATAGLPDHQRELVVMLAVQDFVGSLLDQAGNIGRQVAVAVVDPRRGLLDQGQGMQYRQRHALLANREIDQRTLGLRAPIGVIRDLYFPQAVGFDTAHRSPSLCSRDWSV